VDKVLKKKGMNGGNFAANAASVGGGEHELPQQTGGKCKKCQKGGSCGGSCCGGPM